MNNCILLLTPTLGAAGSNPVGYTIFVVLNSYNRQKAQDTHVSCAFLLQYLEFLSSNKIFEFNSCILALFQNTGLERTTYRFYSIMVLQFHNNF